MALATDTPSIATADAATVAAVLKPRIARPERRRLRIMFALIAVVAAVDLYLYLPTLF